ncbi:uncharacterized protein LOC143917407 [Arctopsyche grandis]|uniref:uncharacterized protein LOC143917407 n=1 Tax=Arctopsyche grandis TaxID=121162 RepID=UPI00406D9CD2
MANPEITNSKQNQLGEISNGLGHSSMPVRKKIEKSTAHDNPKMQTESGRDYEGHIAMLFILRGAINKYRFKVGVEIQEAHKFDDLVFLYRKEGKKFGRCLQAKYTTKDNKKIDSMSVLTGEQSDFSIVKYFFSFKDMVREDYFQGIIQEDLIVYTNCPLDKDSAIGPKMVISDAWKYFKSITSISDIKKLKDLLVPITDPDDILDVKKDDSCRYRFDNKLTNILKSKANEYNLTRLAQALKDWLLNNKEIQELENVIRPYWKFLTENVLDVGESKFRESFSLTNKKTMTKETQLFKQKLMDEIDRINKKKRNKGTLSVDSLNERMKDIKEFPKWECSNEEFDINNVIKEEEIQVFLKLLVFAVSQLNNAELKDIIKADILEEQRKLYGSDEFYTEDDINRYVEEIFQYFHAEIFKWKDLEVHRKKKNIKEMKETYMTDERGKRFLENQWKDVKFGVQEPLKSFIGRDEELEALLKKIRRGTTMNEQINVICGLPGLGKSELIRRFVKQYSSRFENKILWIDGSSRASIEDSFRELAKTLEISNDAFEDIDIIVTNVYKEFLSKKCLFVFDDIQNQDAIKAFMPNEAGNGNLPFILVTSSNSCWITEQKTDLKVLTQENAIKLIENQANMKESTERKHIERLVQILECFPLAIQQVAAYIMKESENNSQFTIECCIDHFSENAKSILESQLPKSVSSYEKTTYLNFKNIINSISKLENIGEKAFEVLGVMSFMAPNNIDAKWFSKFFKTDLNEIFQILKDYSIIRIESGLLNIHSLVQMITRLMLKQMEKEEHYIVKTILLLVQCFLSNSDQIRGSFIELTKKKKLTQHLEACVSYIDEVGKSFSNTKKANYLEKLLWMLRDCYDDLMDPKKEAPVLEKLLQLVKEKHGEEDGRMMVLIKHLARVESNLGNCDSAKALYEKYLMSCILSYGESHLNTAYAFSNLGRVENKLGNYKEGRCYLLIALSVISAHHGEHSVESAVILQMLGNVESNLDNNDKAKIYYTKTLNAFLQKYGEEHVETAAALLNLFGIDIKLGNFVVAKPHVTKALSVFTTHYGDQHIRTTMALTNLGSIESGLGNYTKAKLQYCKALKILKAYFGEQHVSTLDVLINLGSVENELGNYTAAKAHFENILPVFNKLYGERHTKTAVVLLKLGIAESELGNFFTAKNHFESVYAVYLSNYGEHHVETAIALSSLGVAEQNLGNFDKAKAYHEKTRLFYSKMYGEQNKKTALASLNLGIVEAEIGNHELAKIHFQIFLDFCLLNYGEEHIETARAFLNLGNVEKRLSNFSVAKDLYEKSLRICSINLGEQHVKTALVLYNLGKLKLILGDHATAKDHFEKVLAVYAKHYGLEHEKTMNVLMDVKRSLYFPI